MMFRDEEYGYLQMVTIGWLAKKRGILRLRPSRNGWAFAQDDRFLRDGENRKEARDSCCEL